MGEKYTADIDVHTSSNHHRMLATGLIPDRRFSFETGNSERPAVWFTNRAHKKVRET